MSDRKYAKEPTRATTSFTLMLGMVPVAMRLFTPTEASNKIERKSFSPAGNPVGQLMVDTTTNTPVPRELIVKKVEVDKDKWVELTDDEILEVTASEQVDKGQIAIETFVPLKEIGTRYQIEKWYQARPQTRTVGKKSAPDPVADKTFSLLLAALKAEKVAALFRIGIRSATNYAALTPDGRLNFIYYDEQIRAEREFPKASLSPDEIKMARSLIKGIGVSTPELVDRSSILLQEYLDKKAAGKVKTAAKKAVPVEDANVLDLTALLEASVAKAS